MNELYTVSNLARKCLAHRLQDTAIDNITYAVKTHYKYKALLFFCKTGPDLNLLLLMQA